MVAQPLRRAEELETLSGGVWPLCGSGGCGGRRVPLAFGWEVPVSSLRSASRSRRGTQRGPGAARIADDTGERHRGNGMVTKFVERYAFKLKLEKGY